ncbi:MAG TPA: hypothetical protein ENI26_07065 [Methylophaga aminisulfidivorans]|uniref:YtxH domain-containing protein n=2 Tax=root TaxID=1 RepID=A0A7C1W796_9GAMM|nr:hypothetical protein [Methylophaga aminisulfidivorans]
MKKSTGSKTFIVSLRALLVMLAFSSFGMLTACDNEGPAEKMGKEIDNSVEDAGDAIEDAGDSIEDAADDAKDEMEQ